MTNTDTPEPMLTIKPKEAYAATLTRREKETATSAPIIKKEETVNGKTNFASAPKHNKRALPAKEKEPTIWDADGSLLIPVKISDNDKEKDASVDERESTERRQRMEANLALSQKLGQEAQELRNEKLQEDEENKCMTMIEDEEGATKRKEKRNPKEFHLRQQKSVQARIDVMQKEKNTVKHVISQGSKALIRQNKEAQLRSISNDYKKSPAKPKGPKYTFKPDRSATSKYPIKKCQLNLEPELVNAMKIAKQSTNELNEIYQETIENTFIPNLEATEKNRDLKAKRALKRKKEKALKEKEVSMKIVEEQPYRIEPTPKPKGTEFMNHLFSLFKEPKEEKK